MLSLKGISKSFPGVKSLDGVDFATSGGEVRALVGENGAGKSTLIKIIAGAYRADEGEMTLDGKPVHWASPHEARDAGIHVIYQELVLFPELSVAQNIFVGEEPRNRLGLVDHRRMRREAARVLHDLGVELDPDMRIKALSVAHQQMVEIARALVSRVRLLVLDEPTAVIGGHEAELLFQMIRRLRSQGVSIIFISHRLEEVFEIADSVTVLKDGRLVATRAVGELDRATLVAMMVGRPLADIYPPKPVSAPAGEVVLAVERLSAAGRVRDVSFEVRRGEVVGLAGMVGAGRTEVAHAIFGSLPMSDGAVTIGGHRFTSLTPAQAIAAGLGLLTEDRKGEGLMLLLDIAQNITAPALDQVTRGWSVDRDAERRIALEEIRRYQIAAPGPDFPVINLSGGNQQKVLLGRWVRTCRTVLILDEPTRGVDVGAKMEIYRIIRELAERGLGVLVISSEMPEIIGLCDRVVVMREGAVTGELEGDAITEENLLHLAIAEDEPTGQLGAAE
jgi:ABC-type sugar transport system ATPase subunit